MTESARFGPNVARTMKEKNDVGLFFLFFAANILSTASKRNWFANVSVLELGSSMGGSLVEILS